MKVGIKILGTLFFLYAAVMQYNDPDGVFWAALYLVPIVFTWMRKFRYDKQIKLVLSVLYFLYGIYLLPAYRPNYLDLEVAREALGSFIVAFYLTFAIR